jgi:hypothetical protein
LEIVVGWMLELRRLSGLPLILLKIVLTANNFAVDGSFESDLNQIFLK